MSGKPDGTIAAELSCTAIAVSVAAVSALARRRERQEFIEEHGFKIGHRSINRALALRKRPAGPKASKDPDGRNWLWDSLEIDAAKLGLDLIVAGFPDLQGRRSVETKHSSSIR